MAAISNLVIFTGAIVVMVVAAIVFFRGLRNGVWNAIKRSLRVLFENMP
jgi:hypothetical protein